MNRGSAHTPQWQEAVFRGSYGESCVRLSTPWVCSKKGGSGHRLGWVGMHVCHSRVDPRDASLALGHLPSARRLYSLPLFSRPG